MVPMMNTKAYKVVLMYLICLAAGCLCGNALRSLIPEVRSGGGGVLLSVNICALGRVWVVPMMNTKVYKTKWCLCTLFAWLLVVYVAVLFRGSLTNRY